MNKDKEREKTRCTKASYEKRKEPCKLSWIWIGCYSVKDMLCPHMIYSGLDSTAR